MQGYGVGAVASLLMESHCRGLGTPFERAEMDLPEALACHNVGGHVDFLLQVTAKDLETFGDLARDNIRCLPGVKEMNSTPAAAEAVGIAHTTARL